MKAHKSKLLGGRGQSYEAWLLVLLAVPVIFIYADTLTAPFIFDGRINIEENPHIRISRITPKGLATAAFDSPSHQRPVANISFALNYYLHGCGGLPTGQYNHPCHQRYITLFFHTDNISHPCVAILQYAR
jgi:hypothetical protein